MPLLYNKPTFVLERKVKSRQCTYGLDSTGDGQSDLIDVDLNEFTPTVAQSTDNKINLVSALAPGNACRHRLVATLKTVKGKDVLANVIFYFGPEVPGADFRNNWKVGGMELGSKIRTNEGVSGVQRENKICRNNMGLCVTFYLLFIF